MNSKIYRANPHVSGIVCLMVRDHSRYACSKEGITTKETNILTLYMDIHRELEGLTEEAVADAHARDLEVQEKYGSITKSTGSMKARARFFA